MKIRIMGFIMATRLSVRRVNWRLPLQGLILSEIRGLMKISEMGFVMATRLSVRRVNWRLPLQDLILSEIRALVIPMMRYGGRSRPSLGSP
jgi:hypothetical protein